MHGNELAGNVSHFSDEARIAADSLGSGPKIERRVRPELTAFRQRPKSPAREVGHRVWAIRHRARCTAYRLHPL
jgi:hypothetical protein